ncbi:LytTR family transcriptional regulator DNA-binding domain-containing protein [Pedobacter faecalis]|uniref:LytTR family transcriptional regulator DNA-binding domain-containing protein n=1 Tax=Pedobacter faecalis TaxID=3041495 RepID=UPI00254AF05E|nr:LytTR family transcriptional regulator DNA-binding domain-containing protein [Pedobacter sp. ELA7]
MTRLKEITKIELIAFNACVVLALLFSSAQAISDHYSIRDHVYFNNFWLTLFFSHMVTSVCYLLLCLHVQPQMEQEEQKPSNAVILTLSTRLPFNDMLNSMPLKSFVRIHRTYAVARDRITKFDKYQVWLGTQPLPVGQTYSQSLQTLIL